MPNKNNDNRSKLRRKNIAVALAVFGLCVLFYLTTIIRMGGG